MARRHAPDRVRLGRRRARPCGAARARAGRTSVSNSCDWRDRLGEIGGEQRLGVAGLAPAERAEQHSGSAALRWCGSAAPARRRPSRACACRGSRVEAARRASSQRSASRGDSVSRGAMPHLRASAARARGGWWRCRRRPARACPASSGCDADEVAAAGRAGSSAAGDLDREGEGRARARAVALGPHRAAHQLGQPLADREARGRCRRTCAWSTSRPARTTGTAGPCASGDRPMPVSRTAKRRAPSLARCRAARADRQHDLARAR